MILERFERSALAPVPWKNGGGVTREIVSRPAHAGMAAFDWRVSIADIDVDGPFSRFDGIDRVIVLLDGGGVQLRSVDGGIDHRLDTPLVPFAFDGAVAIDCTRLAGASTDFNVMTRRATCVADVRVLRARQPLEPSDAGVMFAIGGGWHIQAISHTATHFLATGSDSVVQNVAADFHSMANFSKGSDPGMALAAEAGVWWDEGSLAWECAPVDEGAALLAVRILARGERRLT